MIELEMFNYTLKCLSHRNMLPFFQPDPQHNYYEVHEIRNKYDLVSK